MTTLEQKATISLGSALLFAIINLPQTYQLTNSFLPGITMQNGCPTSLGLLIHTLVFGLISFLTMGNVREQTWRKVKYSIYGTLIFFFLSSPTIYSLVGNLLGTTSSAAGCPTITGVAVHAFVYFLALIGVMYLPPDNNLASVDLMV